MDIYTLIFYIVVWILTDLLTPAPEVEDKERTKFNDGSFPTASESRPLPVLMGDEWLSGSNVLWYGDLKVIPIKLNVCSGTITRKCSSYIINYKYLVGMHCGLCHGKIDSFLALKVADDVIWAGDQQSGSIEIDDIGLFGGRKVGGGVEGIVDLIAGGYDQGRNAYLESHLGAEVPSYRGITAAVFRGNKTGPSFYIGTAPIPKVFSYRLRWLPTTLSTEYSNIAGQANPAHMIYELYVNQSFGGSAPESLIDTDSFMECAETLYNEGMGLKLSWQSQQKLEDVVSRLEQIIDCKIFPDPSTGKVTLKLLRDDYDPDDLPVFDQSNILSFDNFARSAWQETVNEVRINYSETNDVEALDRCAIAHDLGNLHIQAGERVSTTISYPQIPTAETAGKVAATALRKLSYPLAKCTITTNRDGLALTPGSVFKLNWSKLGIVGVVMRVASRIEEDVTKGTIKISAIQDIFGIAESSYVSPPPTGWIPPDTVPYDVINSKESEAPYLLSDDPDHSFPWLFVAPPSGLTLDYSLLAGIGEFLDEGIAKPCTERGELINSVAQTDTTITVSGFVYLTSPEGDQSLGSTMFYLGEELLSFALAVPSGDNWVLTGCERGLLDTTPSEHTAGAEVWFEAKSDGQFSLRSYTPTATAQIKYLTHTPTGELDEGDATQHNLTFSKRALRPYAPGKVRVNGVGYDAQIEYVEAELAWAERNRLTQTEYIVDQDQSSIAHEAGTTYKLEIYDRNDVLLRTETGLTASPYTYLIADELADTGLTELEPQLTFKLQSIRDSLYSWQEQLITVTRNLEWAGLLSGGTASASAVIGGSYVAANAFDNLPTTSWSAGSATANPNWLKYDLGSGNGVEALTAKFKPYNDRVDSFEIRGSNNDVDWDALYISNHPGGDTLIEVTLAFTGVYQYYQLYINTSHNGEGASVYEFDVFA